MYFNSHAVTYMKTEFVAAKRKENSLGFIMERLARFCVKSTTEINVERDFSHEFVIVFEAAKGDVVTIDAQRSAGLRRKSINEDRMHL
jgi:hypothetical protein